jgi:hypothetical protein
MTKLLATTTLLLTLFASPLMAVERKGYFDCRITQSYAVDFIDGVSKEYHGSRYGSDGPNVGRKLKMDYVYSINESPPNILFQSYSITPFAFKINLQKSSEIKNFIVTKNSLVGTLRGSINYVSKNFFNLSLSGDSLRLFRYFKNDWQGILHTRFDKEGGRELTTTILALDCRHTKDILDEMFTELKGMGY